MSTLPSSDAATAAVLAAVAKLVGPGGKHALGEVNVNGFKVKDFVTGPRTLDEFVAAQLSKFSANEFVIFREERLTYGQVEAQVLSLSNALATKFGVKQGDRVALAMRNFPEWVVGFLAICQAGAISVPLNGWWTTAELQYGFEDSGAKVCICDGDLCKRIRPFAAQLKVKLIVTRLDSLQPGEVALATLVKGKERDYPKKAVQPDDPCAIMYTSGTTGHPKGVIVTHRGVMHQMKYTELGMALTAALGMAHTIKPCIICPVPLFHVTASHHIFLASLLDGRKLVLMYKWDAGEALRLIEKERPHIWTGVPTMIQDLMEHKEFSTRDTSSLSLIGGGGAPTPPSQVANVGKRFKGKPSQGYGLTETNGAICGNSREAYLAKPTSCGQPYITHEVKIIDVDTLKPLPVGTPGELVVRGPLLMKGYWNKAKATKEAFTEDGFFRTGDVARLDSEGFIYIMDRAKDIIIRGGENISGAEVEAAFYHHPAVMEVAAIGMPDDRLGERVGIMVHLKPEAKASGAELVDFVKKSNSLAGFKTPLPADVFFTQTALPRGATGKILKREIRTSIVANAKPKAKL